MKVFSYLLCVIGKLNVKLYEQINKYHTDVCVAWNRVLYEVKHRGNPSRY